MNKTELIEHIAKQADISKAAAGRALEAKGNAAGAKAAYQAAAQHQTAYYGQLAAEKLGLSLDPALISVGQPGPGWRGAAVAGSSPARCSVRSASRFRRCSGAVIVSSTIGIAVITRRSA